MQTYKNKACLTRISFPTKGTFLKHILLVEFRDYLTDLKAKSIILPRTDQSQLFYKLYGSCAMQTALISN